MSKPVPAPIPAEVLQAKLQQFANEDNLAREAGASPRPGAVADAFALQPKIKVGKYDIRPIYDVDFEFLKELENPFESFAVGLKMDIDAFVPRGLVAWQIFWVLTQDPEEIEKALSDPERGVKWANAQARAEFGRCQMPALLQLYTAFVHQLQVFAGAMIGHAGAEDPKASAAEEGAGKSRPPLSSAAPLTD